MGEADPAVIERLTGRMLTRSSEQRDDRRPLELSQTNSVSGNTEDINVEELLLAVSGYDEASDSASQDCGESSPSARHWRSPTDCISTRQSC